MGVAVLDSGISMGYSTAGRARCRAHTIFWAGASITCPVGIPADRSCAGRAATALESHRPDRSPRPAVILEVLT